MRTIVPAVTTLLLLAVIAFAQAPSGGAPTPTLFKVELGTVIAAVRDVDGKKALAVTVPFRLQTAAGTVVTELDPTDQIVVEEDGRRVSVIEMYQPKGNDNLTVDLAMDISGSMIANGSNKLAESRKAGLAFLDQLPAKANCGLIQFNHQLVHNLSPGRDRTMLKSLINTTDAVGGTAYLDATAEAVRQVMPFPGRKTVLVMTDGVDINSRTTLPEVIDLAVTNETRVYTLGVGEPGKNEPVSTVLVLDHSGSMNQTTPAAEGGAVVPKLKAMKDAASRFVEIQRPGAAVTLLPFSSAPKAAKPFSSDPQALKADIQALHAAGETALYDATYNGVMTLEASQRPGKRAVVVLTDGKDTSSFHRVEETIKLAKSAGIPLHMLGLGRDDDIDRNVMERMARETGGTFHHVKSYNELVRIFEKLSIDLHDEGIDQATLKELAEKTGGKFFLARDVSQLQFQFREVAEELKTTYSVTYVSPRSVNDGTARKVDVSVQRNGQRISDLAGGNYNVRGVIIPDMDAGVYLGLLAALGTVLLVPSGIRALYRFYGGT